MLKPAMTFCAATAVLFSAASAEAEEASQLYELLMANPEIKAAGALREAARNDLSAARGGRLPQLRIEGQLGRLEQSFTIPIEGANQTFDQTTNPMAVRATLEQPVFTSGVLSGAIRGARSTAQAALFNEKATRQNIVLAGATAAADLVNARLVLAVREQNEEIIRQRLDEAKSRFASGVITKTDVLQSQSRFAGATAEKVLAESLLKSAEEEFFRVFGAPAPTELALPVMPQELPVDLEEAVWLAEKEGPILAAERNNADAAGHAVREARGRALPQVSISAEAAMASDQSVGQFFGDTERYGVFLNVSMDLFSGGSNRARRRAAQNRARAALSQVEQRKREVRQAVIDNWAQRRAAMASLEARQRQVVAAQQSRDGVVREAEANRRTRLDVLDAELELANARVSELEAERDAIVSGFSILALLGKL